jgi:hypothetical protein
MSMHLIVFYGPPFCLVSWIDSFLDSYLRNVYNEKNQFLLIAYIDQIPSCQQGLEFQK